MSNNLSLNFDSDSKILDGLNEAQEKAVKHKTGPLLIIAGAGTGKTSVITRRIAYIIEQKWALASEILALTFTDKAAAEMEERVDIAVPYGFVDTAISTFNAFGDRVLRDHAIDLGLPANFKILSSTEQAIFMRQNLYAFDLKYYRPLSNPLSHISEILKHFSRLKDELIEADDYLSFAEDKLVKAIEEDREEAEKTMELAQAFKRYQELMIQSGNLDYGDQIYLTFKLLKSNKKVRQEYQQKYKYILVDEFQDTNYAQYQVVKLLTGDDHNITVVGDDDQSIYRFRGASISNIMSFSKDFADCKQIVLNQNYRSTQEILDASYRLIQHNNPDRLEVQNKIDKSLVSDKHGDMPELIFCDSKSSEADAVAKRILELKDKHDYKFRDFVILARANNHLEPFIQSLNYFGVPNIYIGSSSLFEQPEIKALVAFFKCLAYDDDNLSFFQLATSELYDIPAEKLAPYYSRSRRQNKSYRELFATEEALDEAIGKVLSDLEKYRQLMTKYRAGEILYQYLQEKKYFKRETDLRFEIKIANIARFFDRISQFDHISDNKSVMAFLENLELILAVGDEIQTGDIDPDIDAVNLMSAHAAKGLEWPVVFVANLVAGRFPSSDRRDKLPIPDELIKESLPEGDHHKQEERRLFYVAATRARDLLYITAAEDYGGKTSRKLSPFAMELLDQADITKLKHKLSPLEKIELHKPATPIEMPITHTLDQDAVLKLSQQQVDDYYTCPKKYYFASILRIPLPTNWHFTYGTAIHEAIGRYFNRKIRGEKPDIGSLIDDFEQSFRSEGFITREHEEERKRSGIETLHKFYDEDQDTNLLPREIEESFDFSRFGVKISGRYDLVLQTEDNSIEICDFKTSAVKNQKEADDRVRKSTQMKIYALAWKLKYGTIPKTTLIFIENNLRASRIFTEAELKSAEDIIEQAANGIRAGEFNSKPDKYSCNLCSYKDICDKAIN